MRPTLRRARQCLLASSLTLLASHSFAQISKPSNDELNAVPKHFLGLVHGTTDKLDQSVGPGNLGPPPLHGGLEQYGRLTA